MSESTAVGRTGWDILVSSKKYLYGLIAFTVIGTMLIALVAMGYLPVMEQLVIEYWPVLISPAIGFVAASETVKRLYMRTGVVVLVVNTQEMTLELYIIPEETYKLMNPVGNTVVFKTTFGRLVYLARDINWNNMTIDYGWIHSANNAEVLVNLDLYNEWMYTLEDTQLENMRIKHHPHVIAAAMSRKFIESILDDLARVLNLTDASQIKKDLNIEERIAETFGTATNMQNAEVVA